jgi:hypothetical protein
LAALLLSGNTAKLDGINMGITLSDNRISVGSSAINTYISGGSHGNHVTRINHLSMGVKNGLSQIIPNNIFFLEIYLL